MAKLKQARDFWKEELARCEAKLPTLKDDPVRYSIAYENVLSLRSWIRRGIPKDMDQSIYVPMDGESY